MKLSQYIIIAQHVPVDRCRHHHPLRKICHRRYVQCSQLFGRRACSYRTVVRLSETYA